MNTRREMYEKWQLYKNYFIIGFMSMVALFFVPMFGSKIGMAFILPTTAAGWFVWITTRLLQTSLSMLIFQCFVLQAKVNVKDNPQYQEALRLLRIVNKGNYLKPRSPQEYFREVYGRKGVALGIGTCVASIGLTQAILVFDWITMLTYLLTTMFAIFWGILQMDSTEIFWVEEFYEYALQEYENKNETTMEMAEEELSEQVDDTSVPLRGTDVLVPPDDNSTVSTDM